MNEQQLHANGEQDFLNSLSETYLKLKNQLKKNKNISEAERSFKLKEIKNNFEKDKKEALNKVF